MIMKNIMVILLITHFLNAFDFNSFYEEQKENLVAHSNTVTKYYEESKKEIEESQKDNASFGDFYHKSYQELVSDVTEHAVDASWDLIVEEKSLTEVGANFAQSTAYSFGKNKLSNVLEEEQFYNKSKQIKTLPIPINESGSEGYQKVIEILGKYDKKKEYENLNNRQIIINAIDFLKSDDEKITKDEEVKKYALFSLLYFINNDYINSQKYAKSSLTLAKEEKLIYTLPAFIYTTSLLYNENLNYTKSIYKQLEYSFLEENDNEFTPLMFEIYMNGLIYRLRHKYNIDILIFQKLYDITRSYAIKDKRFENYSVILIKFDTILELLKYNISDVSKNIEDKSEKLLYLQRNKNLSDSILSIYSNMIDELEEIDLKEEKNNIRNILKDNLNKYKKLNFVGVESTIPYSSNYQPCLDNSGGVTTAMNACNNKELKYQDRLLNMNYKAVMKVLSNDKKAELRKLQRQWIKYRDAKCGFLFGLTGGTIDIVMGDGCLVDMTTIRAQELEEINSML